MLGAKSGAEIVLRRWEMGEVRGYCRRHRSMRVAADTHVLRLIIQSLK
jgi:hypothetical protein